MPTATWPAATSRSRKSRPTGFAAYPEAVDLAFGPYVKFGTIIKEYRNAKMIYTPVEMVGTKRNGPTGHRAAGKSARYAPATSSG